MNVLIYIVFIQKNGNVQKTLRLQSMRNDKYVE